MSQEKLSLKQFFSDQLWNNNQVLVAILGICSALGVTNKLSVAITMALSVTFVTACSSFFVSLLRHWTPDSVRMIAQLAIIALFVTIIDQVLQAYLFSLSKIMSVFVGLIITNCLVMGRAESMAKNVPPGAAFMDGLGAGMGYGWVICTIGLVRELFGFGEILGYRVIPQAWYATASNPDAYDNIGLMVNPPAAFFIIGTMIWIANVVAEKRAA
jgi:Na+-transporting NADH:ubiquinone oxidoreductase subunit D